MTQQGSDFDRSQLQGQPAGYFVVVSDGGGAGEGLEFGALLYRMWLGRWWICAAVLICAGIAAALAYTTTPIYRSEASFVIRADEGGGALAALSGQLGGLASLAGIGLGGEGGKRKEAAAVLKSRELAAEFVEKNGLMRVFYKSKWDEATQTYRATMFRHAPTFNDAVNAFRGMCKFKDDPKTGLITVSIEWIDPKVATEWVRQITRMANEKLRQKAILSANESLKYLEQQLAATNQEAIRQSLYRLMESRLNERMLANIEPEFAFQVIDEAYTPDAHRFVKPKRLLQIIVGCVLGFTLGGLFSVWRYRRYNVPL